jgi:hypothetical protein
MPVSTRARTKVVPEGPSRAPDSGRKRERSKDRTDVLATGNTSSKSSSSAKPSSTVSRVPSQRPVLKGARAAPTKRKVEGEEKGGGCVTAPRAKINRHGNCGGNHGSPVPPPTATISKLKPVAKVENKKKKPKDKPIPPQPTLSGDESDGPIETVCSKEEPLLVEDLAAKPRTRSQTKMDGGPLYYLELNSKAFRMDCRTVGKIMKSVHSSLKNVPVQKIKVTRSPRVYN